MRVFFIYIFLFSPNQISIRYLYNNLFLSSFFNISVLIIFAKSILVKYKVELVESLLRVEGSTNIGNLGYSLGLQDFTFHFTAGGKFTSIPSAK